MTSGRMITSDTWEDDFITSLPVFDRLLWIGLITGCADDQGRLQDSATLIRSKIFPLDDIPASDIDTGLIRFAQASKIVRYIANGKKLIQIVNWWKHQKPRWAGCSNYPPPPGWTDRERYHAKENELIQKNWDSKGGYSIGYIAPNTIRDVKDEDEVKEEVKEEVDTEPRPLIFSMYEREIGIISPRIRDELLLAEKEYPLEWFIDGFKEAADHNARSWKYVLTILKRWKIDGRSSNGHEVKKEKQPAGHWAVINGQQMFIPEGIDEPRTD